MTPNFSAKPNKRYHYYVSRTDRACENDPKPIRVPARDLERIVIDRLRALLLDRPALMELLGSAAPARTVDRVLKRAAAAAASLASGPSKKMHSVLRELVCEVVINTDSIGIELCRASVLGLSDALEMARCRLDVPCQLFRRTKEVRLMIPGPPTVAQPDSGLIKLVVRAWEARTAFEAARGQSLADIAKDRGMHPDYFAVLVKLGYLSPAIVGGILKGRQRPALTRQKLARLRNLSVSWFEQYEMISAL